MQAKQTIGIDLPLKALVWQDAAGNTFLSYKDPAYVARRHRIEETVKPITDAMSSALKEMAMKSTSVS